MSQIHERNGRFFTVYLNQIEDDAKRSKILMLCNCKASGDVLVTMQRGLSTLCTFEVNDPKEADALERDLIPQNTPLYIRDGTVFTFSKKKVETLPHIERMIDNARSMRGVYCFYGNDIITTEFPSATIANQFEADLQERPTNSNSNQSPYYERKDCFFAIFYSKISDQNIRAKVESLAHNATDGNGVRVLFKEGGVPSRIEFANAAIGNVFEINLKDILKNVNVY